MWERRFVWPLVAALGVCVGSICAQEKKDEPSKPPAKPAQEAGAPKPDAAKPALPECPVMGEEVDFSVFTMTDTGPVYFCCRDCIKKFEANPQKYAAKVEAQRKALAALPRIQTKCPVSGKPIDKSAFIEQDGKKIYFCCKNCPGLYQKEPAKYKAKLEASFTYQTRCPVSGKEIDPAVFEDLADGTRVYFCCKDCPKAFLKDPAKYAPKLEEQGIGIDLKKLKGDGAKPAPEAREKGGKEGGKP